MGGKGSLPKDKERCPRGGGLRHLCFTACFRFYSKYQALVYFRALSCGWVHVHAFFIAFSSDSRMVKKKKKKRRNLQTEKSGRQKQQSLGEARKRDLGEVGKDERKRNLVLRIPKSLLSKTASREKLAASSREGIRPSWRKPLGIQGRKETTKAHCFLLEPWLGS